MKIARDEILRVARQLERTAEILRTTGPKAVQLAEDWSKSPLHAAGSDPGRGKGGHGDPTPDAAMAGYDSPGEQMTYLASEVDRAYDAAVTAGERVLNIARIAVAENERAGIGWCACGRYADGTASNRLRNGQCPACCAKERRVRDKVLDSTGTPCDHKAKRRWSRGVETCMQCGVELTAAGFAVQ